MAGREELLAAEGRAWRELNELIAPLSDEQLVRPDLTADGWSVKDLMWHVARWSDDCARALDRIARGVSMDDSVAEEVETVNRRRLGTSRRLDPATVRAEWHAARARMVERFATVGPLTPTAVEWFEESGPLHYEEHLTDLRARGLGAWGEPA